MPGIASIRHPDYSNYCQQWQKWRDTYQSGEFFKQRYLHRFSKREKIEDFNRRKLISYVPAFSKSAVNNVKNSIHQRAVDVIRLGGSLSYINAINGHYGGVDLCGSTMSYYIGQYILPELLPMGKVGVYVDMPMDVGLTKADKGTKHPYCCTYPIEDILSWTPNYYGNPDEYLALLLRHTEYELDATYNLPTCKKTCYRYFYLSKGQVFAKLYNKEEEQVDINGNLTNAPIPLSISKIPFHVFNIGESLLIDTCNYQIALMNLESSDLAYSLLSNYPFYIEQYEPRSESPYNKDNKDEEEVEVGISQGRKYPVGTAPPAFIHPSSEPLSISITKQEKIKEDIKHLTNLAVSNLAPKLASAESKQMDMSSLEAGLSYIGLVLQNGENKISEFWSLYENFAPASVIYPTEYTLPDPNQTYKEIDKDIEIATKITSPTLKKVLAKRVVKRLIASKIDVNTIDIIDQEIDEAKVTLSDPATILQDIDAGLVSAQTASLVRGYPNGEVELAQKEKSNRLALIQAAQSPVRGIPDTTIPGNNPAQNDKNLIKAGSDLNNAT
jgi:hypothetical protein